MLGLSVRLIPRGTDSRLAPASRRGIFIFCVYRSRSAIRPDIDHADSAALASCATHEPRPRREIGGREIGAMLFDRKSPGIIDGPASTRRQSEQRGSGPRCGAREGTWPDMEGPAASHWVRSLGVSRRARRMLDTTQVTDSVEKVGRESRVRNNRIAKACHSNQRCAGGRFLESKLRRDTLKIIFQHYRPLAALGPEISLRGSSCANAGNDGAQRRSRQRLSAQG